MRHYDHSDGRRGGRAAREALRETPCAQCPLRPLRLFKPVTGEELATIQTHKVAEQRLRPGSILFEEGQSTDRVFTLLEGWAFRFKTLPDGRRQILNFLLPGDLVGLQARLFDAADHGIEMLTEGRLCVFARGQVSELFRNMPELAYDMIWLSAREELMVDGTLLTVGRRFAAERLAWLVLSLYRRAEALGLVSSGAMPFPPTQTHLADALGLSPVHVNRTLQRLRGRGLLELSGGILRNVDTERLGALARWPGKDAQIRPLF